jgi:gliding motility-associated-like protein
MPANIEVLQHKNKIEIMKQRKLSRSIVILLAIFLLKAVPGVSQNPACGATVPYYLIDLTGSPAGVWSSPNISRNDQCCGAPSGEQCISFDVILDPNAAGIQIDMAGADPAGSLYYSINCTGSYPGGTIKCISGVGPHRITFCKPGNNKNIYTITSVSRPLFPPDQHVRIGCSQNLTTLGIVNSSTNWQSIYPGAPGAYNSYLSCTNCASPDYTPAASAPPYIDYYVCGSPQATLCGYNITVCDTVRVYNEAALTGTVSPLPATFCNIGPGSGVTLTAAGSGGLPPYSYKWRNSANVIVSTASTYFATASGNYTVEIADALNSSTCPSYYNTVTVNVGQLPVVNAGLDKTVCAASPTVNLSGTVSNATGGVWTGGSGAYNPGNTFLNTLYTPTSAEILAGSVTLTLTSSGAGGGCTNSTDQVTINFSDSIKVNIPSASLGCNNSSTTLTANVTGGTAPLSYQWNNGSTSSSIATGQGNYSVIVTDVIGCSATKTYNLIAPSALSISLSTIDVTVNGGSNGQASVTASGGTAPYSYLWSYGAQTTSSISGVPYGIYTVTVTDANGCMISGSAVVNEPRCLGFNVTATSTNVSCYGNNNGTGTAVATGGTLPYSYSWNNTPAQTTATVSNLPAGVYTVTVSDSNSCFQTANITITEPAVLTNVMNQVNPTTIGGTNGSASANPFGGTLPYTYSWDTGASTQQITGVGGGVYIVTITDANGCFKIDSVKLIEPPCNQIALSVVTSNVACFGGSTGSAMAVLTNAAAPYTISWSNGQVGPTASGMAAGNYIVTINDANNCSLFRTFAVSQPSLFTAGASVNPISCNGAQDGTVDLTVSGGVYPYTYLWNNGATSEDLVNLGPGTFIANIVDQNGCSASVNTLFTEPSPLLTSYTVQKPTCIFGTDGAINLTVTGGVVPYSYLWSNAVATQDLAGIQAGGYSVAVDDANGCTTSAPIIISVLQPDSVKISSHTIACSAPGSGVSLVTVVPSGGNAGSYQVSFDNGTSYQAAGDYDALLPNGATYTVLVKDNTACTSLTPYTIIVKPSLIISNVAFANCFPLGSATTAVTVTVSGGESGPYSISYDGGATFQAAGTLSFNLAVNNSYSIIAKDVLGCISATYSINIPAVLVADASVTSDYFGMNVSCYGATNGTATTSVTGGTGPYTYSWSTSPAQTTAAAINLGAGNYTVTVTDANGCQRTDNITLVQPASLSSSAVVTSNYNGKDISCNGANDGTSLVTATGGTAPYTYSWNSSPVQTTAAANNLGANTYSVTVTDVNGCTSVSAVTLTQPSTLSATASVTSDYNGQDVKCFGSTDGSALAVVTGGTGPYTYNWSSSPVQTTAAAGNIGAGSYTVTVTDANGCASSATVQLTQPALLTSAATVTSDFNGQDISCNAANDGAALVTPSGGTAPFAYSWNTSPAQATAAANNLGANTYVATVTDANGCSSTSSVTLTAPAVLSAAATVTSDFNGQDISCNGLADGAASASAAGGTGPYSYTWSTSPAQVLSNASGLPAGSYSVNITDVNGCSASATVVLTQPAVLTSSASITSNYNGTHISCHSASDGIAITAAAGGTGPYTYSWNTSPAQLSATANNLGAGSYTATVTDVNGCASSSVITLTQPAALSTTALVVSNFNGQQISCNGAADGSASATVSGGTMPYSYSWSTSPAQNTGIATGLGASSYTVNTTDVNGCTSSATVTLTQPALLSSVAVASSNFNGFNISCNGASDGTIDMTTTGGTAPYQFLWSNASTTEDISTLTAGTYTVSVNDANGCVGSASATLIQADPVSATINVLSNYNGYGVSCSGNQDGTIDINVSGGTSTYVYLWSNGATTQDITSLPYGNYQVTVADANGCADQLAIVLTEPTPLNVLVDSISSYNGYNVSCYGSTNGFISLSTSGGVSPYNFLWNNNALTEDISSISYGGYLVTVTDANNCVLLFDTTLTQPAALTAMAVATSIYGDYNVSCYNSANGSIDLSVNGGLSPYTYTWSQGASTEDLSGLGAATYSVNIVDLNGCAASASTIITQPDSLIAVINSVSDYNGFAISCNGAANGTIDAAVTGGMAPYDYSWSNGNITQDLTDLSGGNYTLTVTDSNNCVALVNVVLTEPAALVTIIDSISQYNGYGISCNASSNGSVYTSVSGGASPYTYLWNNGAVTEDITGLAAGSYVVNVQDINGCLSTADTTLLAPAILDGSYTSVNPGCNGMANGSVDVSLSGGVAPYSYSWNNGATSEDLNNLTIGTYNLSYLDLNGCAGSISVTLTEPQVLENNILLQNVLCYGGSNGAIDVNIEGGTLPYAYNWSNGSATEDIDSLVSGSYYVTITDGQGCTRTDTVLVAQPDQLTLILTSPVLSNGHNISYYQGTDGSIDMTTGGGVQPYVYTWSTGQTTEDVENIPAGQYSVVLTDANGCSIAGTIKLSEPFDLAMPTGITPNADGKNDLFVVKGIEAYPDNTLTVYNRWGNVVYKRSSYLNEWDGTNTAGEELPEGTYFAVMEINAKEIVLNGYVEIRRK